MKTKACDEWQGDGEATCHKADFFLGKARVFKKYRDIFPAKYQEYIEMDFSHLSSKVPMMPHNTCKQLVFGTGEDIVLYIAINNKYFDAGFEVPFALYMPQVWTTESNLMFTYAQGKHLL